ncbi:MAG TPA: dihydrofolate reductase family protein [Flavobacteriales bacterium]
MRPLLLNLAVTLDGYIEGPKGEIDWCLTDQDYGIGAFLDRCDALLMGRKSYEAMLKYDPRGMPGKHKYVFSRTLSGPKPETEFLQGDLSVQVQRLKRTEGKAIWLYGGADVIAQCLEAGLVDELCLSIHPLLLGDGIPLYSKLPRTPLRLLDSTTYDTGLVQLTYAVEG